MNPSATGSIRLSAGGGEASPSSQANTNETLPEYGGDLRPDPAELARERRGGVSGPPGRGEGDGGGLEKGAKRRGPRMNLKQSVRVASLNMNGFGCLTRDHPDNKWGSMYRVMNEERIGVMLLQETHLTESRKTEVQRMFGGRIKVLHSEHPTHPT
ncbi:hypothetical protein ACG7TL_004957 [Trametes sanguinea]